MQKKLTIEGMTCDGCANSVQKHLQAIDGVEKATVNRETKSAVIKGQNEVSDNEIHDSLDGLKYNVVDIKDA
ncbi:heavy-metal-associated domain-containing protein [Virgibacillus kimchii]